MEAIVLAGGMGTRLRSCVSDVPKVLAEVDGVPFLNHILSFLYRGGVTKAVLAVGYLAQKIMDCYGNRYEGMVLEYSVEHTPLGTGGAIKSALKMCSEETVIVVNGDTFFDLDLDALMNQHCTLKADVTVALTHFDDVSDRGSVKLDGVRITDFCEKGVSGGGFINAGVYAVSKNLFNCVEEEKFSFEKDVLEKSRYTKNGFFANGYFIDIGTPDNYAKAKRELSYSITPRTRRALFLDRDGTLNIDTCHLYKCEDLRFIDSIARLVANKRKEGYLAIVVTNQAGVAKGLYSEEDVLKLHEHINDKLEKEYSTLIDAFFYCPHHPDGVVEEYTCRCKCRKPQPAMIFAAVEHFRQKGIELDLQNSVLIGDKPWDIQAGIAAGIGRNLLFDGINLPKI